MLCVLLDAKVARNCISKHDIKALKSCNEQDGTEGLEGLETIPDTFRQAVLETLRTGERVDVSKEEAPAAKPKKARAKKPKVRITTTRPMKRLS